MPELTPPQEQSAEVINNQVLIDAAEAYMATNPFVDTTAENDGSIKRELSTIKTAYFLDPIDLTSISKGDKVNYTLVDWFGSASQTFKWSNDPADHGTLTDDGPTHGTIPMSALGQDKALGLIAKASKQFEAYEPPTTRRQRITKHLSSLGISRKSK